jgi:alpha-mannosidase
LPVWSGELYLEYHRGTYTSQAKVKQGNRRAELALREAECLDALAVILASASPHPEELDALWKTVLLNQFHDILPGSSVPLVYVDTHAEHAHVLREAMRLRDAGMDRLIDQVALDGPSVIALNSLPFPREDLLTIPLAERETGLHLEAPDGMPLPTQIVDVPDGGKAALVSVRVAGYGYAVLRQREGNTAEPPLIVKATERTLDNGVLRLELDDNGEIASLVDLLSGSPAQLGCLGHRDLLRRKVLPDPERRKLAHPGGGAAAGRDRDHPTLRRKPHHTAHHHAGWDTSPY